nr:NAD(P)/FAD-dependent oxidoreductase [Neorickettsia findlayensis]
MNTDVIIIGAGPVGIFAAFQAGMLGMQVHVVDSLFPSVDSVQHFIQRNSYTIYLGTNRSLLPRLFRI